MLIDYRACAALTTTAALAACLVACSSSPKKTTSSTAAAVGGSSVTTPSAPSDYNNMLIAASDIPVPGFTRSTPSAPPNGTGVTASYTSSDGSRVLGDTILVFPNAAATTSASQASITAGKAGISSAEVSTAPIGDGGTAIRGTSAQDAVAILVFTQGRAEVVLQFNSPVGDPVPTSVLQQVATKQDEVIKTDLPQ